MKKFLIFLLLILSQISLGHDIKLAIFEILQENDEIKLTITLDREDFLNAAFEGASNGLNDKLIEAEACGYFDENLAISIDQQCTNFNITEIEFDGLTVRFSGFLLQGSDTVSEISMTNTCLISYFSDYDNIMKLKINEQERSFRMNQNRTTTAAVY